MLNINKLLLFAFIRIHLKKTTHFDGQFLLLPNNILIPMLIYALSFAHIVHKTKA